MPPSGVNIFCGVPVGLPMPGVCEVWTWVATYTFAIFSESASISKSNSAEIDVDSEIEKGCKLRARNHPLWNSPFQFPNLFNRT